MRRSAAPRLPPPRRDCLRRGMFDDAEWHGDNFILADKIEIENQRVLQFTPGWWEGQIGG